jgi:hypothetical protein
VLGCFLFIAGLAFLLIRKKQTQEKQKLLDFTNKYGWQLEFIKERLVKGIRISSNEWALESIKRSSDQEAGPGSSEIEQTTTWSANQPGTTLLIGKKYSKTNLPSINSIIKQIIQKAIGDDANGLSEVKIGTTTFQDQFMVWAKDVYEAEEILTPDIQSDLLSWNKGTPLIKRTQQGISIELKDVYLNKPEEILKLVKLGKKLL